MAFAVRVHLQGSGRQANNRISHSGNEGSAVHFDRWVRHPLGVWRKEMTRSLWEVDGAKWTLLVSASVTRRPDGRLLGLNTVGTLDLQMQDGRPVGWTASGQGKVALASGKAAALEGKAFTWTGRTNGPGVYTVDVTMP